VDLRVGVVAIAAFSAALAVAVVVGVLARAGFSGFGRVEGSGVVAARLYARRE
jgi:hypothetical protein